MDTCIKIVNNEDDKNNKIDTIYTVFCKIIDLDNVSHFNLLKKAFKTKYSACEYAVSKITTMLNEINIEYRNGEHSKYRVLPIHATVIYVLYSKKYDPIDQYEYFLSEYNKFFHGINFPKTMFFVSEHKLI